MQFVSVVLVNCVQVQPVPYQQVYDRGLQPSNEKLRASGLINRSSGLQQHASVFDSAHRCRVGKRVRPTPIGLLAPAVRVGAGGQQYTDDFDVGFARRCGIKRRTEHAFPIIWVGAGSQQSLDRRRVARIGDEGHIDAGRALEHLECELESASLRTRQRHVARLGTSRMMRSASDRRSHVLTLTEKGGAALARARKIIATKHESRLAALLGPADRATLQRILTRIVHEF